MPRPHPRTPEQAATENAQARSRRAAKRAAGLPDRPPRSTAEIVASRERSRRHQRQLLGWPAERLGDPPQLRAPAREKRPVSAAAPIPALCTGHELYAAGRALLRWHERDELAAGDMDSGAADLVATYALAALEGHDPVAALVAARRRHQKDRAVLIHGLGRVDDLVR